ncbi:insulinase family protein [Moritella marina ATCC 15381]|uniref:Insulinase family protein n=1 Tax=Moritella marina ATCC 15381 TaxID=1202962 RepID=A0A5J6WPK8_MORMI|nr:pitrilysin family protein [Moritella marina]QFI39108.1 insulinase family protein [Moritella marina ATCC 15381]
MRFNAFYSAVALRSTMVVLGSSIMLLSGCSLQDKESDAAALPLLLPAGMTLVDKQMKTPDSLLIPYEKYKLSNGLTVILHEDDSDPLTYVDMTYHVGSAREELGKSGFAHFFEHMMFQGSKHVGDQQHFKIVNEAGGSMNGSTNQDRTNYYQTVPANQLEKMLWLESDRMGFLLDAVDQRKFEIQRATVKNERSQRVDNRPYGLLGERVGEALYPREHPYAWQPIGYVEDLDRVDVNDLKQFFLRWYGPNNATLTIAGKFDKADTLDWVNKYFATIPEGPEVKDVDPVPVSLDKDRYITLEDNVPQPMLYLSYPTVYMGHKDEAPLDLFAYALGGGKNSVLYKDLVETGYATNVAAYHSCSELSCTFDIYTQPNPAKGMELAPLLDKINGSIKKLAEQGIADSEVTRLRSIIESSTIFGMQSVAGKAKELALGETLMNDPNYITKGLAVFNDIQAEEGIAGYKKYLEDKPKVIMSVVPKGKLQYIAHEPTFIPEPRNINKLDTPAAKTLAVRTTQDNFDRSVMPSAGSNPQQTLPALWRQTLANDIQVLGTVYDETPTVSLQINLKGGRRVESTEQQGIAKLTAAMMNQSTALHSAAELNDQLQSLGSSIHFSAGLYGTVISVNSLSKNLPATLAILEEKLFKPGFVDADFVRIKAQTRQASLQNQQRVGWLGQLATQRILYGEERVTGNPSSGSLKNQASLTADDVLAYYQQYYNVAEAKIVVVGDVSESAITTSLDFLQQGAHLPAVTYPTLVDAPLWQPHTLYIVDKPDAVQSVVKVVSPAIPYDVTGNFFKANLMNFNLGGNFNSRLNQNLREDKGYTYGATTGFYADREYGYFSASADVRAEVTGDAIQETLTELKGYVDDGITDTELEYMKSAVSQQEALSYETPGQKSNFLMQLLLLDLSPDFVEQQAKIIQTMNKSEIQALAKTYLSSDQFSVIVVGDRQLIEKQVKDFGFDIKIFDLLDK